MSDPEPIEKVMRKIKRKWDKDQEGWSVLGNVDKDGNKEMLISQQPDTYWLKMKTITAYNHMAFGKTLHNIDDEIQQKLDSKSPDAQKIKDEGELMQLFGMMVPSKKDLLITQGIERVSPKLVENQKEKIEEKESDADKLYRLYLRKKWQREQELRENMYL